MHTQRHSFFNLAASVKITKGKSKFADAIVGKRQILDTRKRSYLHVTVTLSGERKISKMEIYQNKNKSMRSLKRATAFLQLNNIKSLSGFGFEYI